MAAIQEEIEIERSRDRVWDAVRDVGAIHRRLVPGFVANCRLDRDGKCRVVWIADLLPNEIAETVGQMIQQALTTMKTTLESGPVDR